MLRRAVHRYNLHKHVRFLGYQTAETLAVLYRLADVFVFPSLYEGFGLSPLEAIASGTPVVASNVSSLPEVLGDAAVLVDPLEPGSIADGITRVLEDDQIRAELRRKGLARAARFSWERSVKQGTPHLRGNRGRALSDATHAPPAVTPADVGGRRVAVVHDWLTGMRGGEVTLEAILELVPHARLLTLVHVPGSVSARIEAHRPRPSFVQRLPLARTRYRQYLPLFPAAVEQFDLDEFELVISTSHCAAKAVVPTGRARHLCYCFTPMRYAWDQFDAYFGPARVGALRSRLYGLALRRLARWDAATAGRVDRYVAISRYVASRIDRYYNRIADVLEPPVDTRFYHPDGVAARRLPHHRFGAGALQARGPWR